MDELKKKNVEAAEAVSNEEDNDELNMVIKLRKPYKFDGVEYTEIDLSGMEDLSGSDMIAINRIMNRTSPGIDVMPEVSMEYACHFAAKAAKQPVEFFTGLPAKELTRIKNRVMGFLFGSD